MRFVPLLLAGLFRKKTRTVLTLLSVMVAFMLFGLLQAVTTAFESGADSADAKRLLTTARYSIIELLPLSYLRRIEGVPGVVGRRTRRWFGAKYQNERMPPGVRGRSRALPACTPSSRSRPGARAFVKTRTAPSRAAAGGALRWKVGQEAAHCLRDPSPGGRRHELGVRPHGRHRRRGSRRPGQYDMVLINVAHFDEARQNAGAAPAVHHPHRGLDRPRRSPPGSTGCSPTADETKTQPRRVRHRLRQADRRHRWR